MIKIWRCGQALIWDKFRAFKIKNFSQRGGGGGGGGRVLWFTKKDQHSCNSPFSKSLLKTQMLIKMKKMSVKK